MLTSESAGRQKPPSETSRVGRSLVTLERRRVHGRPAPESATAILTSRLQRQQGEIADRLRALQAQLLSAAEPETSPQTSPLLRVFGASSVAP